MNIALILLVFAYIILHTFTFRFQRVTLYIARFAKSPTPSAAQASLTPAWMGALGWINMFLWFGLPILLFIQFSWVYSLAFLLYAIVGAAVIDNFIPYPTYKYCFELAEKTIKKNIINNPKNISINYDLLNSVQKLKNNNSTNL